MLLTHGISKRYGAVTALDGVDVSFSPGEIHAVLGENGAGKSTLVGVLAGFVCPDSGHVTMNGLPVPARDPRASKGLGIELIHQHFTLVPQFSIAENLALPKINRLAGYLDVCERAVRALEIGKRLGWEFDPNRIVGSLPVGSQQRLEILKALASDATTLIFDEPTAVLTNAEVNELFEVLTQLKADGNIVVLIAHKLSEVLRIADRVTVLRRGVVVGSAPRAETDATQLAQWMVGDLPQQRKKIRLGGNAQALRVEDLRIEGDRGEVVVNGLTFEVGSGEIFGIGGVDGNGQVELAEALACIRPKASGRILWRGEPLDPSATRIAYVPQDRQIDGLAMNLSVQENLLLGALSDSGAPRGLFSNRSAGASWAADLIRRFDIRVQSQTQPVRGLSGGNQQKIVVSRALARAPELIVAVNLTRGLDLRAARYVQDRIVDAAESGAAVVLFTTDLDELFLLSTSTKFMNRGQLFETQNAGSLVGDG